MTKRIGIVDYGMGNLGSIAQILKKVGTEPVISSIESILRETDALILPGVGAFDEGVRNLQKTRLFEFLSAVGQSRAKPILGICLGMQLLGRSSEEGKLRGLSLIPACTIKFRFPSKIPLKIPHMGWSGVEKTGCHPLLDGLGNTVRFYFVHSYHVVCDNDDVCIGTAHYGVHFAAAVAHENIMGVQFHPEKSHTYGLQLLRNFIQLL